MPDVERAPVGTTPHAAPRPPIAAPRVLVPRPAERSAPLVRALGEAGFEPDLVPLLRIDPPEDLAALREAVAELAAGGFDWLAVTSASAVPALVGAAAHLGTELARAVAGTRVGAVGVATAAALRAAGVPTDLVAERASAAGLLARWPAPPDPDHRVAVDHPARVLLPLGNLAAPTLAHGLRARGWAVRTVVAYRTTPLAPPPRVVQAWSRGEYAAVLLTSASTARQLVATMGPPAPGVRVCCIGPTTARAARSLGLRVRVAADPGPAAMIAALTELEA